MNGWVKISIDTCVLVWPGLDRATWWSAVQFAVAGPRLLFIVFRSRWYTIVYFSLLQVDLTPMSATCPPSVQCVKYLYISTSSIYILSISNEITLSWMPRDLTDDWSRAMVWCRQATSRYLNQRCPRYLWPYGFIKLQCVKRVISKWFVSLSISYEMFLDGDQRCHTTSLVHRVLINYTDAKRTSGLPVYIATTSHEWPVSHNALFCNRNVCTFLLQNGALWDICFIRCGICDIGLFTCLFYTTSVLLMIWRRKFPGLH